MSVALLRVRLRVVLAALDAAGGVQAGVDRLSTLLPTGHERRSVRSQHDEIVAGPRVVGHGRGGGPWLGGHGTGREGGHPEPDGAHVLADVPRALAVVTRAV